MKAFCISSLNLLLVFELDIIRPSAMFRLFLVLAPTVPPDEVDVHETRSPACEDGDFSRHISRSVFGPESLRADDISHCHDLSMQKHQRLGKT